MCARRIRRGSSRSGDVTLVLVFGMLMAFAAQCRIFIGRHGEGRKVRGACAANPRRILGLESGNAVGDL